MGSQLCFKEGQHPFALDQLCETFFMGSYQGVTFDEHSRKVLQDYLQTETDVESVHEFYYQEIKELYRLNLANSRIYGLDDMTRHKLEQVIIHHHGNKNY